MNLATPCSGASRRRSATCRLQTSWTRAPPTLDGRRVERGCAVHVDADITRLAQALSNLLDNSAKFSPPGANICIATSQQDNDGHVDISVSDAGIGIPLEGQRQIFDMFMQLDQPGEREGLGLGLTLVKRIVELHGGSVQVFSEGAGKGSTLRVRLAVAPTDGATHTDADTTVASEPESADRHRATTLPEHVSWSLTIIAMPPSHWHSCWGLRATTSGWFIMAPTPWRWPSNFVRRPCCWISACRYWMATRPRARSANNRGRVRYCWSRSRAGARRRTGGRRKMPALTGICSSQLIPRTFTALSSRQPCSNGICRESAASYVTHRRGTTERARWRIA
jgi:Histidine kinase-, DNA gyrase B-, and HSP90-like ATPase